ncbi:hypothetical protein [Deinococcus radiotolerans]|nr:hypothetical protein [Deinococcus radiotolerans]
MTRLLLALAGVVLLAVTALAAVWLLGQLLTGLGLFIVGAAGVLGRLLWFLLITGVLAGVVYFVTSAWRPSVREPVRPLAPRPLKARAGRNAPEAGRAGTAVRSEPVRAEPVRVPPAPVQTTTPELSSEPVRAET